MTTSPMTHDEMALTVQFHEWLQRVYDYLGDLHQGMVDGAVDGANDLAGHLERGPLSFFFMDGSTDAPGIRDTLTRMAGHIGADHAGKGGVVEPADEASL